MPDDRVLQAKREAMFRDSARARLERLNLAWILVEQGGDGEGPAGLLRELHTLKGEASILEFRLLADLVHALEGLLKRAEARGTLTAAETGDLVLRGLDVASGLVEGAPEARPDDAVVLVAELEALAGSPAAGGPPAARAGAPAPPVAAASISPVGASRAPGGAALGGALPADAVAAASTPPVEAIRAPGSSASPVGAGPGASAGGLARADRGVTVSLAKLDRMRDVVGELLLAHVRLQTSTIELRRARETALGLREVGAGARGAGLRGLVDVLASTEARLREDGYRVARLAQELEGTVRELRMVPVGSLFDPYPRAVRSLARELGRQIRLVVGGEAVEIDWAVWQRISEPILHLVRNAADHGIEPPEVRLGAGKPAEGTITLGASLAGGWLQIDVHDDGAGIDADRVRQRAVEIGLTSEESARALEDEEIYRYLFASGMSTRKVVSRVSGRGVGLDVVASAVEELGGRVSVRSAPGAGTTFTLSVPVTVAITSVLLFRVGGGRYALPTVAVESVVDAHRAELADGELGPRMRHGDAWIPTLSLPDVLHEEVAAPAALPDDVEGAWSPELVERIIVVRAGPARVALRGARGLLDREVVLKSAGRYLDRQRLVTTAIPMEDGALALLLKPVDLATLARTQAPWAEARPRADRVHTVLVVDDSPVVRDILAESLRAHGAWVLEAGDGVEALTVLETHPGIRCVVSDIDMPRLDGLGLLRAVRERDTLRDIPVVVVTMREGEHDRLAALEAGARAYLTKSELSHGGLWTLLSPLLG